MNWGKYLQQQHASRRKHNLWRSRRVLDTPQQARICFAGSEKPLLNFSSNDYLGLANHPDLVKAMQHAAAAWGAGSGASHLVSGHQAPHHALELELAEFVGAEKALLFSTGYMANLAVPSAFLGRDDVILQDKLNHASLLDGGSLSQATLKRYRHVDVKHAEALLRQVKSQQFKLRQTELKQAKETRLMLSTDGVFSMDGNIAPLPELKILCDKHDGLLLVDDAHGLGVLGKQGQGSMEMHNLSISGNVLQLGTLGKAFGSFGAFVAGDEILIEHLLQYARPYIYTTALPAAVAEASRAALKILQQESWRREKLIQNITAFKQGAQQLGLNLMPSDTPIQPLLVSGEVVANEVISGEGATEEVVAEKAIKQEEAAIKASSYLQSQGFYITAIRPPTVPVGTARLRITFSAEHEEQDIQKLLACLDSKPMRGLFFQKGLSQENSLQESLPKGSNA